MICRAGVTPRRDNGCAGRCVNSPGTGHHLVGGSDMPKGIPGRSTCTITGCERTHHARGWCAAHWTRWKRHGHPLGMSRLARPPQERFWFYVGPATADECWVWRGGLTGDGYGQFHWPKPVGAPATNLAHRFSYELMIGPIPDGLHLDHLCRNRSYVNPLHLEAVTRRENILRGVSVSAFNARKTHCKNGHKFTPENTYFDPVGFRHCRACHVIVERRRRSQTQGVS